MENPHHYMKRSARLLLVLVVGWVLAWGVNRVLWEITEYDYTAVSCQQPARHAAKLTIVIMGYSPSRTDNFRTILLAYRSYTDLVDKIIILWQNPKHPPPSVVPRILGKVPVVVIKTARNTLNNRFLPLSAVDTDAVLTLDDDFLFPEKLIRCAMCQWLSNTQQLVGFDRRWIKYNQKSGKLVYKGGDGSRAYNLVTGQSMLWHKRYADAYMKLKPLHELVDGAARHCDDIAMNALVGNITKLAPAYVYIPLLERWRHWGLAKKRLHDGGGLSQASDWHQHRNQCANLINDFFSPAANSVFKESRTMFVC